MAASPAGARARADFVGFADLADLADFLGFADFADFAEVLAGAAAAWPVPGFMGLGRFVAAPVAVRVVVLADCAGAAFPTAFAADFFVTDFFVMDFPAATFVATACFATAFLGLRATTVFTAA